MTDLADRIRRSPSIAPSEADLIEAALAAYARTAPAPGQRTPATAAVLAERGRLLREIASGVFPGQSVLAQAEGVHALLNRYAVSSWLRDRDATECPTRIAGTPQALCWRILRLKDGVPSVSRLRQLLTS